MHANRYGPYGSRSAWKTFLMIVLSILLILIVLGVALHIYFQQHLVVSQDGVRLDLPFLDREDGGAHTMIRPPADTAQPTQPPVEVVVPEAPREPRLAALAPVAVPRKALRNGSAAGWVVGSGSDCALFDMKADDGSLAYVSALEWAESAQGEELNQSIAAMNATRGLYTVARVSCFKDSALSERQPDWSILTNSGVRWTDGDGMRWVTPASQQVREYVSGVCVELAGLGFDEILLDNAGYPGQGSLEYIRRGDAYDEGQISDDISAFYAQVRAALAPYDVKLSVVTTQNALDGEDALTGQTPQALTQADRLWLRDASGTLAPIQEQEEGRDG